MEDIVEIMSKCSPIHTGSIFGGGWNWFYPAIGKVAGTAGNLERWATGYKHKWESLEDSHEEITLEWDWEGSKADAFDWYDNQ